MCLYVKKEIDYWRTKKLLLFSTTTIILMSSCGIIDNALFPHTKWNQVNKVVEAPVLWANPSFQMADEHIKISGSLEHRYIMELLLYIKNESKYPLILKPDNIKVFSISKNSSIPSKLTGIMVNKGLRKSVHNAVIETISVLPNENVILEFAINPRHLFREDNFRDASSLPNIRLIKISIHEIHLNSVPRDTVEFVVEANRE